MHGLSARTRYNKASWLALAVAALLVAAAILPALPAS